MAYIRPKISTSFWGPRLVMVLTCMSVWTFDTMSAQAGTEQESIRSTRDGIYSDVQAGRGQSLYGEQCAACHGQNLAGTQLAPQLAGEDFIKGWADRTVGELFERIRFTMPEDGPGRLSDQQYADVVAFMIKSNGFPSSDAELAPDVTVLKQIEITAGPGK
jgi:mono/diheme cytochrome c family protein